MCTANILTMEKIETSLTATEVNMDTFQDEEDIVDADLKIKGQIELSKKNGIFKNILCRTNYYFKK